MIEGHVLVHHLTTDKGEARHDNNRVDTGNPVKIVSFDNVTSLTSIQNFWNTDFVDYLF